MLAVWGAGSYSAAYCAAQRYTDPEAYCAALRYTDLDKPKSTDRCDEHPKVQAPTGAMSTRRCKHRQVR